MKKSEKIAIGILLPLSIVLLILYVLTTEYARAQQNILAYPEGGLSDSLFVQQNNSYTKNDALPVTFAFNTLPYYIDTMKGSQANVGQGWIIQASDSVFIFLSEYNDTNNDTGEDVILREFPSAILIDYDPVYTYTQQIKSQNGYINGFEAEYSFDMITVSNGKNARTCYYAAYDLKRINEQDHDHMLVAVVTTTADSQSFTVCKNALDAMARSIRYDEKLNKKIEEAKKEQLEKEQVEQAASKSLQETSQESEGSGSNPYIKPSTVNHPDELIQHRVYDYNFDSLVEETDEDAKFVPLTVEKNYSDMYIYFTMENLWEDFAPGRCEFTLYNAMREKISSPEYSEDGSKVTFHVGEVTDDQQGLFIIKITHYSDFGKGTVEVSDGPE